jgi:hypothetical protein
MKGKKKGKKISEIILLSLGGCFAGFITWFLLNLILFFLAEGSGIYVLPDDIYYLEYRYFWIVLMILGIAFFVGRWGRAKDK